MASDVEPRIERILETVLYCRGDNRDRFYDEILGLRSRRISAGAYRIASSMLPIFNADRSTVQHSPRPH